MIAAFLLSANEIDILLEEDRSKSTVESTDTLALKDLSEATNQTVGEAGSRDEANTGSLEKAERNGGEELGSGGREGVDGNTVLASLL